MRRRDPRRRRVVVRDVAHGSVSPADLRAYLLAIGCRYVRGASMSGEPYGSFMIDVGHGDWFLGDIRDDSSARQIQRIVYIIARVTKRVPGNVLRAIEAHARGAGLALRRRQVELEARRLAADADRAHRDLMAIERDDLTADEVQALEQATSAAAAQVGALTSLTSSLDRPAV
jgi:hypothetical protein